MMRRKNLLDGLLEFVNRIPSWLCVCCAAASYLGLHWYYINGPIGAGEQGGAPAGIYYGASVSASIGQYLLPALFLLPVLFSTLGRGRRKSLYRDAAVCRDAGECFERISSKDFGLLVAEYYRKIGYGVRQQRRGRDGEVSLVVKKGKEKLYVKCSSGRDREIGEKQIHEFLETLHAARAAEGCFVTAGSFSFDAAGLADTNNIRLLDGENLVRNIKNHAKTASEVRAAKKAAGRWYGRHIAVVLAAIAAVAAVMYSTELSRETGSIDNQAQIDAAADTEGQSADGAIGAPDASIEDKEYIFSNEQVKEAMAELLRLRRQQQTEEAGAAEERLPDEEQKGRQLYEIELHSGGWIYTDNLVIGERSVTYTGGRGVAVSLNRGEIKSIKKINVND